MLFPYRPLIPGPRPDNCSNVCHSSQQPCPPTQCPPSCPTPNPCTCSSCPPPCPPPCPPQPCPPQHRPSCPPEECYCGMRPNEQCMPGYLLPRVIASGRQWQRRCAVCLCVEGLPSCATPPFTLLSVTAADGCTWEALPQPSCTRMLLHVVIPLLCQVRDCNGCIHVGRASIETDVAMQLNVRSQDSWRSSVMVQPCVRLVCLPCASERCCFDAQLEVVVEAFMTRWELCHPCGQKSVCQQDLPLYPQPRME